MASKGPGRRSRVVTGVLAGMGAIGLLLGAYWYGRPGLQGTAPVLFEVTRGDFTASLRELGEVRALESITIRAEKDGPIAEIVPEGRTVEPGDVVVRFDSTQQEAALAASRIERRAAESALRGVVADREAQRHKLMSEMARLKAEARVAEVELADLKKKPLPDELEKARLELEKAELNFEQAERKRSLLPGLVEKGFITQATLDEAEANYLAAKSSRRVAQFNLEKVSAGATPEELEKATVKLRHTRFAVEKAHSSIGPQLQSLDASVERQRAAVAQAKHLVAKAEAELAKTRLRAPKAGLVVYAKPGGSVARMYPGVMVFAGQSVIYLPDMSTMVVDTEINEYDIGKVKLGAPVGISLDAYPGLVLRGKVLGIGTLATVKPGRSGGASLIKVFDVTVKVEDKDPRIKPGLTAALDIIVEHRPDVIAIPLLAVAVRHGAAFVFVANGQKFAERKVTLGATNDQSAVVLTGLRPGEHIRLDAGSGAP